MFSLFRHHQSAHSIVIGRGLLFNGLLSLFFGIAILLQPDLLAFIVAFFFIIVGTTLLITWFQLRK